MPYSMDKEQLLLEAPFRDIFALVSALNEKTTEYQRLADADANKTALAAEIGEIKQVIISNIIPLIVHTNIPAIRQGTVLIGSQNEEIVRVLNNRLLDEIKGNPLNFEELYKALAQVSTGKTLHSDDSVQAAKALTEKMDSVHAPDIGLTCLILQSMYAVLFQMIKDGKVEHIYAGHKKQIEKSLASFENRLQAVKPKDDDEQGKQVLANLHEAIKFSRHALTKLGDHRTNLNRTLHRIKIAGSLLLQAAEVGAEGYGAVATMGVGAPSAIGAAGRFITRLARRTKKVYRYFHDNKSYFTALKQWSEDFEGLAEKTSSARTHINSLKRPEEQDDEGIQKSWYNPHFQLGVMRVLGESYSLYPELQGTVIGLLVEYYKRVTPSETDEHSKVPTEKERQRVKAQAAYYLLKILEEDKDQNKLTTALKQSIERTVTEEDKKRYHAYQQATAAGTTEISKYNLAMEGWGAAYSEDVRLYQTFLSVSKQEEGFNADQVKYLRNTKALAASMNLSSWGKKLLSLISDEELNNPNARAPKGKLDATYKSQIMGTNLGLTPEVAKQLGLNSELISTMISVGTTAGTKALGEMKLSDDIKEERKKERASFKEMILEATRNVATTCHYYNQVMGCLVFDVNETGDRVTSTSSSSSTTSSSKSDEKKSLELTR